MSIGGNDTSAGPGAPGWIPPLLWAVGLLSVFLPMIRSGLELTHGGLGDPRLVHYILEHGFRWMTGAAGHESFWSPPVFYPHPNVSAYTDLLLGYGPLYWPWRLLHLPPDTSFQLWMLGTWSTNFLAAFLLLRHGMGAGRLGAACGAYLIAFGNPLQSQFGHPQLTPLFYPLLAILALCQLFRRDGRRRPIWAGVFCLALVLQFHSAFYTFFFFGLGLFATLVWALAFHETRDVLLRCTSRHWKAMAALTLIAALSVLPAASHYLSAADEVGPRPFQIDRSRTPIDWLWMGRRNVVYGDLDGAGVWHGLDRTGPAAAVGFLTLGVSLWGLWRLRSSTAVLILALGAATVVLAATRFAGFTPWEWIRAAVPGAGAVRVLSRVGILASIPLAVGLSGAIEALLRRRRYVALALLIPLCFAEQLNGHGWLPKAELRRHVQQVAERIDPGWQAFLLIDTRPGRVYAAEDAMWAGLAAGVPTVNGRYGSYPPGYGLQRPTILNARDRVRVQEALDHWIECHGLDPERVGWLEYSGFGKKKRRRRRLAP